MLSNVRWCGMVVLIRMLLMVCNSMRKDLGNTSKNDRLFVGSRATVYIRITFIIEELPFLHFLLIVLYSTKMYGLGCHLDPLVLFLDMNFEFELKSDYTIVTNFVYVWPHPLQESNVQYYDSHDIYLNKYQVFTLHIDLRLQSASKANQSIFILAVQCAFCTTVFLTFQISYIVWNHPNSLSHSSWT